MATFLSLPIEIRSTIYPQLFSSTTIALLHGPLPRTPGQFSAFLTAHNLSILLTSKLLAHEAIPSLYDHATFNVSDILPSWVATHLPQVQTDTSPSDLPNTADVSHQASQPSITTTKSPAFPLFKLSLIPHLLRRVKFYSLTIDNTLQKPFVQALESFRSVDMMLVTYGDDRSRLYDKATAEDVELLHRYPKIDGGAGARGGEVGEGESGAGIGEEESCGCPRCQRPTGRPWKVFAVRTERTKARER